MKKAKKAKTVTQIVTKVENVVTMPSLEQDASVELIRQVKRVAAYDANGALALVQAYRLLNPKL